MNTSMKLRDGRTLDVFLGGDPKGFPLVMHHGTPAERTRWFDRGYASGDAYRCNHF